MILSASPLAGCRANTCFSYNASHQEPQRLSLTVANLLFIFQGVFLVLIVVIERVLQPNLSLAAAHSIECRFRGACILCAAGLRRRVSVYRIKVGSNALRRPPDFDSFTPPFFS